ncbi:MAG: PPK2 family polyphosphate kinase [Lapillicoccus sp.]
MAKTSKHAKKPGKKHADIPAEKPDKKLVEKVEERDHADAAVVEEARTLADELRADKGFVLADLDPESTPGFSDGKKAGQEALADHASELGDWQEKLFAESKGGGHRSVLLVVQGMDTSGKGGLMRHVVSQVDPEGIKATAFKAPTAEERQHDFLWRIRNALPSPGKIGVFDRSHYEDVLVVRVHDLVPRAEWTKRYALINAFEREVIASGTRVVKVMTHISKDEQKSRLRERLERPDKHYKYNPGDIDERERWDAYMEAYQAVLDKTSTKGAPWYVVPANKKWYARYAVQHLLLDALADLDPTWPEMGIDVPHELERLDAS